MAGGIDISFELNRILADIQTQTEIVLNEIDFEFEASCLNIVAQAKIKAAKDFGKLAQQISYVKEGRLQYTIVSGSDYSAYMEFGTKDFVDIPEGWEEVAEAFKGVSINSGGLTLYQAIKAWAQRNAIDNVYGVYIKILHRGVYAHPYLIPAYEEEVPKLLKRIKSILGI